MKKKNLTSLPQKNNLTFEAQEHLLITIKILIAEKHVDHFYFGGTGEFDDICYEIVSTLQKKYPQVKRIICINTPRFERDSNRLKTIVPELYEEVGYFDLDFSPPQQSMYFSCKDLPGINRLVCNVVENEN